jgi:hypothetical protein
VILVFKREAIVLSRVAGGYLQWPVGNFLREMMDGRLGFGKNRKLIECGNLSLFLIMATSYQNGAVLVRGENPNFTKKGVVLILAFICFFFFQEGILVTYNLQNDVVLIFPSTLMITTNGVAKMQLFRSLGLFYHF